MATKAKPSSAKKRLQPQEDAAAAPALSALLAPKNAVMLAVEKALLHYSRDIGTSPGRRGRLPPTA